MTLFLKTNLGDRIKIQGFFFRLTKIIGIGIDGVSNEDGIILAKKKGKVKVLADEIASNAANLDLEGKYF